jgi:hypothetical protein
MQVSSESVMTVLEWFSTDSTPAAQRGFQFDSGIIIFCGIGLLLSLGTILFGWPDLPSALEF